MEHKKLKFVNVLLVIGIIFFIALCITSFVRPDLLSNNIFELLLMLQIILGVVITTSSALVTKHSFQFFCGLMIFCWGIFIFILTEFLPFNLRQTWPCFGLISSLCLFLSGYFKYKKMKVGFVFPSIVIFCFSCWYSLFSFKIIKLPFSKIVLLSSPWFLATVAVFLIFYFLVQQKNKNLIIKEEEAEAFSEDE